MQISQKYSNHQVAFKIGWQRDSFPKTKRPLIDMQCVFNIQNISAVHKMTKKIVIYIEKYLRDYKNSHIFAVKD
jgi:hypothetical protein